MFSFSYQGYPSSWRSWLCWVHLELGRHRYCVWTPPNRKNRLNMFLCGARRYIYIHFFLKSKTSWESWIWKVMTRKPHYHTAFLCCLCCINRVWLEEEEEDYIMHGFCPCSFAFLNLWTTETASKIPRTQKRPKTSCKDAGLKNWFLVNGHNQTTSKESLLYYGIYSLLGPSYICWWGVGQWTSGLKGRCSEKKRGGVYSDNPEMESL